MAWQNTIVPIVRGLIFDIAPPYTYICERLEGLIVVAAILVSQEVSLSTTYVMNLQEVSITPDPSVDEDFVALVSLKAACIISSGEYRDAGRKAVSVKDGPSFIDTKDRAKHLAGVAKEACKNYDKAKVNYQIGDGSVGRAIVGPYATGAMADSGRRFN